MKYDRGWSTWSDAIRRVKAWYDTLSVTDGILLLLMLRLVRRMTSEAGCDARCSTISRTGAIPANAWHGTHHGTSRVRRSRLCKIKIIVMKMFDSNQQK